MSTVSAEIAERVVRGEDRTYRTVVAYRNQFDGRWAFNLYPGPFNPNNHGIATPFPVVVLCHNGVVTEVGKRWLREREIGLN
jgi:hypothetical protein